MFTHPTQRTREAICRCAELRSEPDPATQNGRVLAYIRSHPGATVMECARAMDPYVSNVRARHSDLRVRGFDIRAEKRADGHDGFTLHEPDQRTLGLAS